MCVFRSCPLCRLASLQNGQLLKTTQIDAEFLDMCKIQCLNVTQCNLCYSCTRDKDIWDFTLGSKILSYPCYLTQAVTWGLHTLVVWEQTQMVVKWRHCYVKVTSCEIASQCIQGILEAILIMLLKKKKKKIGEQENKPLCVWGQDRKICPSGSPFVITRQASCCQTAILGMDFSILPSHSW